MRAYEHDHDEGGQRAARVRSDPAAEAASAALSAAAGRTDVTGPSGVLSLQRAAGNAGVSAMLEEEHADHGEPTEQRSPVHDVVGSGGGQPLDTDTRADMEARLGHDFGDVRVHTDDGAHQSAKAVNAHAYTVGSNVVFQRDQYDPSSTQGRTTLAHELTHVVQQRSGPVDGTPAEGGIALSDPSDRFEREAAATAERAMAAPEPASAAAPAAASVGGPSVQREAEEEMPEEESVQGSFVQRQEEEVPEEESAG